VVSNHRLELQPMTHGCLQDLTHRSRSSSP
jgi:hypothetical protein